MNKLFSFSIKKFSDKILNSIVNFLGSRTAVFIALIIPFISLPSVIETQSIINFILWFSSEFLQLIFLPILQRAGNLQSARMEYTMDQIDKMLEGQDNILKVILGKVDKEEIEIENILNK